MRQWVRSILGRIAIISLVGCSTVTEPLETDHVDMETKQEFLVQLIIDHWDEIGEWEELPVARGVDRRTEALRAVEQLAGDAQGRKLVEFCYAVGTGEDVSVILERARALLSEQEYEILLSRISELEAKTLEGHGSSRSLFVLDEDNKEDFFADLQRLVVSTTVLLTASVVYAAMPTVFCWGKVSALAAVSVSAGVVAGTLVSVYPWYELEQEPLDAFKDWLNMVTKEPHAAYLLTVSVISIGHSMHMSPVSCGIIIGIFGMYNALDIVRQMLETYGEES